MPKINPKITWSYEFTPLYIEAKPVIIVKNINREVTHILMM